MLHIKVRTKIRRTVGDIVILSNIVILSDENLVRATWSLARVVETTVDADGLVRRVKVIPGDSRLRADGRRVSVPIVHKLVFWGV